MIDREARDEFAELVRHLANGRVSEKQFDEAVESLPSSGKDPVFEVLIEEIYEIEAVPRREVARWILFLQSDMEYSWPKTLWDGSVFLVTAFLVVLLFALFPETPIILRGSIAALLVTAWLKYECWQGERWKKSGDFEVWPFLYQADFEEARRHPRLLNGGRR